MPTWFNIIGLVVNLAGVILLFRYGMPFRVPTEGEVYIVTGQIDQVDVLLDKKYTRLGWLGLFCIVAGTGFQIAGALV